MATSTGHRLFRNSVDLSEDKRAQLVELLNARLADVSDLKSQTKYAHWNVRGMEFIQLHELFDSVATHLEAQTDLIAERITALGGTANGTARQAAKTSSLPEYELQAVSGEDHVQALTARLGAWAGNVRKDIDKADDIGDKGTSDLLTEVLRETEKDLWFVEAHLQR
ncbi:MAG TPA: DNA starvation/stationary phase protection protein Dps [Terriglobales bacterium]|nr:DNA starvation/stationary phase protection protein Dps [Terriglobales bacterium]